MIISRTPFRISFFGGGTDYPTWYRERGGAVLATTIDKYTYLSCRHLPPFFDHRIRVVYSQFEACQSVDEIKHPAVREVLRYLNIQRGIEIHYAGDLPARSGIGSSSTFTVGLLHAIHALKGHMPSKHQLATEAIYIEQDRIKETVGSQDQVSAAYGGLNHITFATNGEISVRPMTLTSQRIHELNDHLMLFFTGFNRTASNIAASYVQSVKTKEDSLTRMFGMVEEAVAILSGGEDLSRFGKLLHDSWMAKRSLGSLISNAYIEEIYDAALESGAIGGKLIGAGGGGFMLFFVHPTDQARVKERLSNLIHVPIRFEFSGSQIIFYDPEEDYSQLEAENPGIREFKELPASMNGSGAT